MKKFFSSTLVVLSLLIGLGVFFYVFFHDAGIVHQWFGGNVKYDDDFISNIIGMCSVIITISVAYNFFSVYHYKNEFDNFQASIKDKMNDLIERKKLELKIDIDTNISKELSKGYKLIDEYIKKKNEELNETIVTIKQDEESKVVFALKNSINSVLDIYNANSMNYLNENKYLECTAERLKLVDICVSTNPVEWGIDWNDEINGKVKYFTRYIISETLRKDIENDALLKKGHEEIEKTINNSINIIDDIINKLNDYINKYENIIKSNSKDKDKLLTEDTVNLLIKSYNLIKCFYIANFSGTSCSFKYKTDQNYRKDLDDALSSFTRKE